MLESSMDRRRKDQIGRSELFNAAKTLEFRGIHQFDLEGGHLDIAMDSVADEFSFTHGQSCYIGGSGVNMSIHSITHTFFDIELEPADSQDENHLVKVLSVDGRRFTYELRAPLTEEAVNYIKSLLDAAVFNDVVIEPGNGEFEVREPTKRLKKHS